MSKCELCGEPMAEAESMFKYHGSLGPCPKPPLPKPVLKSMVEYYHRDEGGKFYLDIRVDRQPYDSIACSSAGERQRMHDDLMQMLRSTGATDLPNRAQ